MKNKLGIITILILTVALAAGLVLINRNQDTRKSAHFAEAKMYLMPDDLVFQNGEEKLVHVYVDSGDIIGASGTNQKAKVQNIQTQICYSDNLEIPGEVKDSVNYVASSGFEQVALARIENSTSGEKCLSLAIVSDTFDNLKSGDGIDVATIKFKAVKVGDGTIAINQAKSVISGENAASDSDKYIKVASVAGTNFVVADTGGPEPTPEPTTPPTGNWPVLKFKIAFRDIDSGAKCGETISKGVSIIALGPDGSKKEYNGINVVRTEAENSKGNAIYEGMVELKDFSYADNVAIFVKGPRDLQWKYGEDKQKEFYNKAGGTLSGLTKGSDTKTFDFSEFPLIPGDVTSDVEGVQDGQIDGRDYSYVKAAAAERKTVSAGEFLATDFDGDCGTYSRDINALLISIREKQEQLY